MLSTVALSSLFLLVLVVVESVVKVKRPPFLAWLGLVVALKALLLVGVTGVSFRFEARRLLNR